jgi:hypothetical protein
MPHGILGQIAFKIMHMVAQCLLYMKDTKPGKLLLCNVQSWNFFKYLLGLVTEQK